MSGVFRNIDPPPPPHLLASVTPPPAFVAGGGHTRWVERGRRVNFSEDARQCSVLYIVYTVYVSTLCPAPLLDRKHYKLLPSDLLERRKCVKNEFGQTKSLLCYSKAFNQVDKRSNLKLLYILVIH